VGRGNQAEVGGEFFGAGEPGDVPDGGDEGQGGVAPDAGDGGEELCLGVFCVIGLEVFVDAGEFFLYLAKDGEHPVDAGDAEGLEVGVSCLGENVYVWFDAPAEEVCMDPVFELCLLFGKKQAFSDESFEVSHVLVSYIDVGYKVASEEVGEDLAVYIVGFYFCFSDGPGFYGVDQGDLEAEVGEYFVDVFPDAGGFDGDFSFFDGGEEGV